MAGHTPRTRRRRGHAGRGVDAAGLGPLQDKHPNDGRERITGVNTNVLSPPTFLDEPSGNRGLNGIPVTVTPKRT